VPTRLLGLLKRPNAQLIDIAALLVSGSFYELDEVLALKAFYHSRDMAFTHAQPLGNLGFRDPSLAVPGKPKENEPREGHRGREKACRGILTL
jgi:hypothetical protein